MENKIELITDKVRLSAPEKSDAVSLYYLRTNAGVNKYIQRQAPQTIADVEEFIEQRNSDKKDYYFIIKTLSDPELVGAICLKNVNTASRYAEVGYELLPDFHRKGIMTSALRKVIDFAFNDLNLETVEAFTHAENVSSRKLLEKFNFRIVPGKTDPHYINNVIYRLEKPAPNTGV